MAVAQNIARHRVHRGPGGARVVWRDESFEHDVTAFVVQHDLVSRVRREVYHDVRPLGRGENEMRDFDRSVQESSVAAYFPKAHAVREGEYVGAGIRRVQHPEPVRFRFDIDAGPYHTIHRYELTPKLMQLCRIRPLGFDFDERDRFAVYSGIVYTAVRNKEFIHDHEL